MAHMMSNKDVVVSSVSHISLISQHKTSEAKKESLQ